MKIRLKEKKIIQFLIIIIIIIFLHYIKVLAPVESLISQLLSPIFKQLYSAGLYLNSAYYKQADKRNLGSLVENLESQINFLTSENTKLKLLGEENKELREYLNFLEKNRFFYIMGNIISYGELNRPKEERGVITIDRGEKEGVKKGFAVINKEGVIVGKIIGAKDHIATACLITNPNCKIAAALLGKNKTIGVAEGESGLTVKIQFIPQTDNISAGDTVITSGLGEEIPSGLVLGKVVKINNASNELWQTAIVMPQADFNNLTIVSILIPAN
jgi:rod shape-determining protein MreC